jgi:hypothetical protein
MHEDLAMLQPLSQLRRAWGNRFGQDANKMMRYPSGSQFGFGNCREKLACSDGLNRLRRLAHEAQARLQFGLPFTHRHFPSACAALVQVRNWRM